MHHPVSKSIFRLMQLVLEQLFFECEVDWMGLDETIERDIIISYWVSNYAAKRVYTNDRIDIFFSTAK